MLKTVLPSAVALLASAASLFAQNTGARATPQTNSASPASQTAAPVTPGTSANSRRSARGNGSRGAIGGSRQAPAPAANSSVNVIGGTDANGRTDPSKVAGNAPLPGVLMPHNTLGVSPGTPIQVRLQQPVDSGHARNGDTVQGVLVSPLGKLAGGAPVKLTVVAAAAAGQIGSGGVLSIQVVSVNGEQLLSQVVTAEGKEGTKILPDDAPARGTEAIFSTDQTITLPAA